MSTSNAKADLDELNSDFAVLFKGQPEVMGNLNNLMSLVSKDGALPGKTKELMAVSIAIATKCEGCILFHLNKVIKFGATRDEVLETIAVAIEMGGGPSSVYGAKALKIFDQLNSP
jgi:AhpD family alkylhydroperoxidase